MFELYAAEGLVGKTGGLLGKVGKLVGKLVLLAATLQGVGVAQQKNAC